MSGRTALDALLTRVTTGSPSVPGVVAVATDRDHDLYAGAAGVRTLGALEPMTTDTVCAIYSTTKAITATACLQLVEDGRLDLDAPAAEYLSALGGVQVLVGFADDGTPRLRPPARPVTTRMLLLHTAGFGYDFFNADYDRLARDGRLAGVVTGTRAALNTPLLFDPGTRWEYGSSLDWAGQVIEAITGERLGEVMRSRILEPLGMTDTAFRLRPDMRARRATVHQRRRDGTLRALPDFELPQDPEVEMGGHGLYSTAPDYTRFIRMWLRDGTADSGARVLRPETVELAARNGLDGPAVRPFEAIQPALTNAVEFFPGVAKSWGLSFLINDTQAPTGRSAGSLAWAGLINLYYWIDRSRGLGGFWATQLFPFADPTSYEGYLDFETLVYETFAAKTRQ